jgi:molybdate transport system substrate-binding protein
MPLIFLIFLITVGVYPGKASARDVVVFAAASSVQVMTEISTSRNANSADNIRVVYGSSGALARQIETGAPADIFFSANTKWVDFLTARNVARTETRKTVFRNRIVLITPARNHTPVPFNPATDLAASLGTEGRLAIGDPQHVPAGIYARQALSSLGIWGQLSHRIVQTQNVRLAMALVQRGEALLGIVYYTDAIQSGQVRIVSTFNGSLHAPIQYEAIATQLGNPAALRLLEYLGSDEASKIYRKFGFLAH